MLRNQPVYPEDATSVQLFENSVPFLPSASRSADPILITRTPPLKLSFETDLFFSVRDLVLLGVVDQGVRDVRPDVGLIRSGAGRVAGTTIVELTGAHGRP